MASVADILSMASKFSGLRAESAELDVALMAMNRAYLRACLDTELTGADATYTATSSAEAVAASALAGTSVHRVQHVRLLSGGVRAPLQQVSRQELLDYRATEDVQGLPAMYSVAMVNGTPTVDFYPPLGSGDQVKVSYLAQPLALATATAATATTALTYLPEMFHHDIVTNAAVAALLERDGKMEQAQYWNARSMDGMTRLEEYLGQMGGTANRAYISPSVARSTYPDVRGR